MATAPPPARTSEEKSDLRAAPRRTAFNSAAHGLRGIASLMVFWAHLLSGMAEHVYASNAAFVASTRAPWHFGTYGVELFFVLSGFVILPSVRRYSAKEFAIRRFLRLYPLFFALSVVFVVLNALTDSYPKLNTWQAIASGFLFLNLFNGTEQLTPNAWSLTYEVFFYVLLCTAYQTLRRHRQPLAAAFAVGLFAWFWFVFPIVTFFVFGLVIRLVHDRGWRLPEVIAWPLEAGSCLACVYFASRGWFAYSHEDLTDPVVLGIMISTALYFLAASQEESLTGRLLGGAWVRYLGTVSYSLYLVHPYTYFACRILFKELGLFGTDIALSLVTFYAVTTSITLLATHYVHRWLEVLPYQAFFHQRVYRA
ncbi:MAG: acyltransferase [Rhizobiaceae bacterium]|nr:MAG: acyltransferase [Rhizobiaceae bacterium]